jgi:hypothetical protein
VRSVVHLLSNLETDFIRVSQGGVKCLRSKVDNVPATNEELVKRLESLRDFVELKYS